MFNQEEQTEQIFEKTIYNYLTVYYSDSHIHTP